MPEIPGLTCDWDEKEVLSKKEEPVDCSDEEEKDDMFEMEM